MCSWKINANLELHHSKYIKNLNPIVVFMFQRSANCLWFIHPFSWLLIQLRFLRGQSLSQLPVYHRATCDLYPTKNTFVLLLKSTKHLKLMSVTFVEVIHNFDYFLCWIDLTLFQLLCFISCQYALYSFILVSVHNKRHKTELKDLLY